MIWVVPAVVGTLGALAVFVGVRSVAREAAALAATLGRFAEVRQPVLELRADALALQADALELRARRPGPRPAS